MVDWIKQRIEKQEINTIVESLLDELVSKDSSNQYGMDNMSAILIKFNKKKWEKWSNKNPSIPYQPTY